jgi:hypothetical protein
MHKVKRRDFCYWNFLENNALEKPLENAHVFNSHIL